MLKRFAAPFAGGSLRGWWLWAFIIFLAPFAYWAGLQVRVPQLREPHLDSPQALGRAIAFGETLGIRVRDWNPAVHAALGAGHSILARDPVWRGLAASRRNLAPITTIRVVLIDPEKRHWFAVWLRPDGAIHAYDTSPDLMKLGANPPEAESRAMALGEARRAFPGVSWGEPELETAAVEGTHGVRRYLWRNAVFPGVESKLTVETHGDRITERTMRVLVNQGELPVHESRLNGLFSFLSALTLLAGGIYAVYRFSRRALEREISWTRSALIVSALTLLGLAMVLVDPSSGTGGLSPERMLSPFSNIFLLVTVLNFMLQGIAAALIYGAGEGEIRESYPGKITSFDALFSGYLHAQSVGRSLVVGAAAGGWAFLAVRLMPLLAGYSELRERSLGLPYGRFPWFSAFVSEPVAAFFTACFCLLLPLLYISRHLGQSALRRAVPILFCLLGTVVSGYQVNVDQPASIGIAVVIAALVLTTFWYGGFLAAIIGLWWFFAFFENHAIAEVVTTWSANARPTYALAALSAAYGWWATYYGREVTDAEVRPQHAHRLQERLQLEQEVSAAREAQKRLLPDALPDIPGVGLAASCHPAREVGGDFYDFYPLSRGRHGIFVADGSSGGLASALTIGLAKGFLSYAAQRDWPPAQALARLQPVLTQAISSTHHHFSLCYAVLDPAMGEIRIARLGRYPRLFHFHQNRRTIQEILPPDGALSELRVTLHSGDLVLLCTDGLATRLEARMGCAIDAWLGQVENESSKTAERFHEDLLRTVNATGSDLADDITAVVIEMKVAQLQALPGQPLRGAA